MTDRIGVVGHEVQGSVEMDGVIPKILVVGITGPTVNHELDLRDHQDRGREAHLEEAIG